MSEFGESIDLGALQKAVLDVGPGRKRADAPEFRLTASTFPNNASILDWAMSGELTKCVRGFNNGGTYNPSSREFLSTDFYLMRIFDTMEELGRKKFETLAPGIWDFVLSLYYKTFSTKIVKNTEPPQLGDLYENRRAG